MPNTRRLRIAAIAAVTVLAIAAPGASAQFPLPFGGGIADPIGNGTGLVGLCGRSTPEGQAGAGAAENQVCQGAGLVFVGPAVGQIASVIGPTIIGPTVVGNIAVSAGPGVIANG